MTRHELEICEKACLRAIQHIKQSQERFKLHEQESNNNDNVCTVHIRIADNNQGYAEGIYNTLSSLGYKSEKMNILKELI
jgi:hypothetical protein